MLDASFVREVAGLQDKAHRKTVIATNDPNKKLVFSENENGSYEYKLTEFPAGPVDSLASDVDSLVRFVLDYRTADDGGEVWYDRTRVTGYTDARRYGITTLEFSQTPAFAQLSEWSSAPRVVRQAELYHTLRTTFRGTVETPFVSAVGSLKWTFGETGESDVKQTGRSMSKAVTSKILGIEALPDETTFTVNPVDEYPAFRVKVQCYIRALPESQSFELTPYPGEIFAAEAALEEEIERLISVAKGDAKLKVYRGVPSHAARSKE